MVRNIQKYNFIWLAALAFIVVLPSVSKAAIITSLNRATFQAAVAGGTINGENFDGLTAGTILGATPDLTYSASMGEPIVTSSFLTTTNPNGLGSTSIGFFGPGTPNTTETATFAFNAAITAFAIDINTFATANGAYTATLDIGDIVTSIFEVFPSQATGQFIGFASNTAFNTVTIASGLGGFSYTLDTLVYGNAAAVGVGPGPTSIPEPASLALLGLGLAGLGFLTRRRRRAQTA